MYHKFLSKNFNAEEGKYPFLKLGAYPYFENIEHIVRTISPLGEFPYFLKFSFFP